MARKHTMEEIDEVIDQFQEILRGFKEAQDEHNKSEWGKCYGDRLGKYADKLKAINGDDFDVISESYKEYNDSYGDMDADDYVNALEENIKKVLKRIWPEATEEQVEQVASDAVSEMDDAETQEDADNGEMATSDSRQKRIDKMKESWLGSPHTSGGRDGHTSDEDEKEELEDEKDDKKAVDTIVTATPTPVDDVVVKAVEILDDKPESKAGEDDINPNDPVYKKFH